VFELWTEAVRSIEPLVKPAHRDLWLRPIECVAMEEGHIRLRAPNRYNKEWFEDNFLPSILKDLEARAQRTFSVEFELVPEAAAVSSEESPSGQDRRAPAARPAGGSSASYASSGTSGASGTLGTIGSSGASGSMGSTGSGAALPPPDLVNRYTFDKFVVGPTNSFAHTAAKMVAAAPASRWNPLFIHGGVGLGKTHLLHAIGHEIHRQHPDWRVTFATGERFVTEFIGSLMNQKRASAGNSMEEFRARYRTAPDVLLVDDIQFLSNKDSSQDEFFHTFNALHYAHKQIVLASDKLPAELPGVEDRLRSRFTWGLIAEVETPDLGTRVAILKRKAELENVDLSDEAALYIAAHVNTNVRELEGALSHLAARASFQNQPITMELVHAVLAKLVTTSPTGLTVELIQRDVAAYFDVKLHDLKGQRRHRVVAHPRMVAMYLTRKLTNMSYPEIGSRFGGKDHSTVMSAVRKIERLCAEDAAVRSVVATIESRLRQP
jgi:chromosomal replication initiator protein